MSGWCAVIVNDIISEVTSVVNWFSLFIAYYFQSNYRIEWKGLWATGYLSEASVDDFKGFQSYSWRYRTHFFWAASTPPQEMLD